MSDDHEDDGENIQEIHQAIIQFMIRLKIVTAEDLKEKVFKKLYLIDKVGKVEDEENDHDDDAGTDHELIDFQTQLDATITTINNHLHDLGFMVKKTRNTLDNQLCYLFINLLSDDSSKLITTYSPKEIQVINKLIDTIMTSENRSINNTEAVLAIANSTESIYSRADAIKLLQGLVNDKWLDSDASLSTFTLSGRLIAELGETLRGQYGESLA